MNKGVRGSTTLKGKTGSQAVRLTIAYMTLNCLKKDHRTDPSWDREKRRVREANDSCASMWDYAEGPLIIHAYLPGVWVSLSGCPARNDIFQPFLQLATDMTKFKPIQGESASDLHQCPAGLAPLGSPLCFPHWPTEAG